MTEQTHKKLDTKLEKLKSDLDKLLAAVEELQVILDKACSEEHGK